MRFLYLYLFAVFLRFPHFHKSNVICQEQQFLDPFQYTLYKLSPNLYFKQLEMKIVQ